MLTGLFIVNVASCAELRPKAGLEPQLINGEGRPERKYFLKSILDEDGYSEGLWRTAKANLIKDHAFCSGSPESNNFEGTERFLEHQLEKGVKFIGALAVNWLILRKLSIKGRHHRHTFSEHRRTHAHSVGAVYPALSFQREVSDISQ